MFNLNKVDMLVELKKNELVEVNGGHHGDSYNAGVAVGKFLTKATTIFAIAAIILMPKS